MGTIGVLGGSGKPHYRGTMIARHTTPPTLAELELIAADALGTVPAELRRHVGDVVIRV